MGMQRALEQEHKAIASPDLEAGVEHADLGDRLAGGPVPAVHGGGAVGHGRTASELAYQVAANEEDGHTKELKQKVSGLCQRKFGGDYQKAFNHYDGNHDGAIDADELSALLDDAGVGSFITRGAWVKGILDKLDRNADRKISWGEFQSVFGGTASA